jgi:hypothetical protein
MKDDKSASKPGGATTETLPHTISGASSLSGGSVLCCRAERVGLRYRIGMNQARKEDPAQIKQTIPDTTIKDSNIIAS